jgi:hypothetical protein
MADRKNEDEAIVSAIVTLLSHNEKMAAISLHRRLRGGNLEASYHLVSAIESIVNTPHLAKKLYDAAGSKAKLRMEEEANKALQDAADDKAYYYDEIGP